MKGRKAACKENETMEKSIGMIEFSSIARGIYTADQMVKTSDVEVAAAASTCPGKYTAIVYGDVSAVQTSVDRGLIAAGEFYVDHVVIPRVHEGVFPALASAVMPKEIQAVGILEAYSQSAMLTAADLVLKAAELEPVELRLGTGLGGKAFFVFTGDVAAVEAGLEAGKASIGEKGMLLNAEVIPSPAKKFAETLY